MILDLGIFGDRHQSIVKTQFDGDISKLLKVGKRIGTHDSGQNMLIRLKTLNQLSDGISRLLGTVELDSTGTWLMFQRERRC